MAKGKGFGSQRLGFAKDSHKGTLGVWKEKKREGVIKEKKKVFPKRNRGFKKDGERFGGLIISAKINLYKVWKKTILRGCGECLRGKPFGRNTLFRKRIVSLKNGKGFNFWGLNGGWVKRIFLFSHFPKRVLKTFGKPF